MDDGIPDCDAVRAWRRDGTRNVMTLRAAVANLTRNVPDVGTAHEVAARLVAGEELGTKRATFTVKR